MQIERLSRKYLPFVIGTLIWGITVLWVNFHGAQWYNFDMFADASVAKRMAERCVERSDWQGAPKYVYVYDFDDMDFTFLEAVSIHRKSVNRVMSRNSK